MVAVVTLGLTVFGKPQPGVTTTPGFFVEWISSI